MKTLLIILMLSMTVFAKADEKVDDEYSKTLKVATEYLMQMSGSKKTNWSERDTKYALQKFIYENSQYDKEKIDTLKILLRKVNSFSETSPKKLKSAVESLKEAQSILPFMVRKIQVGNHSYAIKNAYQIISLLKGIREEDSQPILNSLLIFRGQLIEYLLILNLYVEAKGQLEVTFNEIDLYLKSKPLDDFLERRAKGVSYSMGELKAFESLAICHYYNMQFHSKTGNFKDASIAAERALSLLGKIKGPKSVSHTPVIYDALGNIKLNLSDYSGAESYYKKSLEYRKKNKKGQNSDLVYSYFSLASFYSKTGDYQQADENFTLVIQMLNGLGVPPFHPFRLNVIKGKALNYRRAHKYKEAEALYSSLLSNSSFRQSRDYNSLLGLYASMLLSMGEFSRAAVIQQEILNTSIKLNDESMIGLFYNNLGFSKFKQGKFDEASELLGKSLVATEAYLGKSHLEYANTLMSLSHVNVYLENYSKAFSFAKESIKVYDENLQKFMKNGSSFQKMRFIDKFQGKLDYIFSLNFIHFPGKREVQNLAIDSLLNRKGIVLDSSVDFFSKLDKYCSGENKKLLARYRKESALLSTLVLQIARILDVATFNQLVKEQRNKVSMLEEELRKLIPGKEISGINRVELNSILPRIPKNSIFIEFVKYKNIPYNLAPASYEAYNSRYGAFVFNNKGLVLSKDLGDSRKIDKACIELLVAINKRQDISSVSSSLYDILLKPLNLDMVNNKLLLICPDSLLSLIPFEVIKYKSKYLLESHYVNYMTSSRELASLSKARYKSSAPVIIANPDYNFVESTVEKKIPNLSGISFGPLPGADKEGQVIKQIFRNAILLSRTNSTEKVVRGLNSPAIIHFATHGFYLNFLQSNTPGNVVRTHPMAVSGVALTGANFLGSDLSDGFLSALEVSSMNLRGTQLVTLSACDTGLGKVERGKGVQGLKRAFMIAGVETIVSSLWKVDDLATSSLMQSFYSSLKKGGSRIKALRDAKIKLLNTSDWSHPYYWAAFLSSGHWGALNFRR